MKEMSPVSLRLEPDLHERLEKCAVDVRIKKYSLMIMALEALADAIEKNGYKLAVPVEFDLIPKNVVVPRERSANVEQSLAADQTRPSVDYTKIPGSKPSVMNESPKKPKKPRRAGRFVEVDTDDADEKQKRKPSGS
jgi:hypothetical protein